MSKEGIHYPIWVKTPSEMDITREQFYKLSYAGLGSLLVSWRVVIEDRPEDQEYRIYGSYHFLEIFGKTRRFAGLKWYENPSVEMFYCKIPYGHPLIDTINKYFSRYKLKPNAIEERVLD